MNAIDLKTKRQESFLRKPFNCLMGVGSKNDLHTRTSSLEGRRSKPEKVKWLLVALRTNLMSLMNLEPVSTIYRLVATKSTNWFALMAVVYRPA